MPGRQDRPWPMPGRSQSLGAYLRAARIGKGLAQDDLVRLTGLSLSSIRKIEDGRTPNPGLFTVRKLWSALNLPADALARVSPGSTRPA